MQCPYCQHPESRVLESRSAESGKSVRRRRECLNCQRRFTTYERIEYVPITVVKRDGSHQSFDRSKLLHGMVIACEKTDVSEESLLLIIDEIEAQLQAKSDRLVSSAEIGEMVLSHLRNLNEVAYVRFASVYRKFKGVDDFAQTLQQFSKTPLLP